MTRARIGFPNQELWKPRDHSPQGEEYLKALLFSLGLPKLKKATRVELTGEAKRPQTFLLKRKETKPLAGWKCVKSNRRVFEGQWDYNSVFRRAVFMCGFR